MAVPFLPYKKGRAAQSKRATSDAAWLPPLVSPVVGSAWGLVGPRALHQCSTILTASDSFSGPTYAWMKTFGDAKSVCLAEAE